MLILIAYNKSIENDFDIRQIYLTQGFGIGAHVR